MKKVLRKKFSEYALRKLIEVNLSSWAFWEIVMVTFPLRIALGK